MDLGVFDFDDFLGAGDLSDAIVFHDDVVETVPELASVDLDVDASFFLAREAEDVVALLHVLCLDEEEMALLFLHELDLLVAVVQYMTTLRALD